MSWYVVPEYNFFDAFLLLPHRCYITETKIGFGRNTRVVRRNLLQSRKATELGELVRTISTEGGYLHGVKYSWTPDLNVNQYQFLLNPPVTCRFLDTK
jgi:hypothetical protein